jgi:hypothetical protein
MTGCFVNDKQRFPRETIREEGVCFIGICETIKNNFTHNWFKNFFGNKNFIWENIPPVGISGGFTSWGRY